ncbi:MAG: alanine racemase [Planctomycetes bacterium]|nr:alanine racemase [Planctomycetota bacterium]
MDAFASLDLAPYALPDALRARVHTPALCVFLDAVRHDLRTVIAAVGDVERWRPHVKTTKLPEVWDELLRAGVRRFKCATTREAAVLLALLTRRGIEGAEVLLAYPLVGPALELLGRLARMHVGTRVAVLVEDADVLASVPEPLRVMIDVNVGMDRTGVPLADEERIVSLLGAAGARGTGLHAYDGHLYDADRARRRARVHAVLDRLCALHARLLRAGLRVDELCTSGTPGFLAALSHDGVARLPGTAHRVSPGTVVFHDARCEEQNPELPLRPAALVLARVVSRPAPGRITLDAGSKALAAEAGDPCAVVLGRPGWRALGPSEEHLPIALPDGERPPALGTQVLLVPRHVCPTVNLAERALLVEGDGSFRVAEVLARGHELGVA